MRFVTIHRKFYFAYASPNHGFGLCQWQGVMGFESCVGVPVGGISHVAVLTTSDGAFTVGVREFDLILHKALFRGNFQKHRPYNAPFSRDCCNAINSTSCSLGNFVFTFALTLPSIFQPSMVKLAKSLS